MPITSDSCGGAFDIPVPAPENVEAETACVEAGAAARAAEEETLSPREDHRVAVADLRTAQANTRNRRHAIAPEAASLIDRAARRHMAEGRDLARAYRLALRDYPVASRRLERGPVIGIRNS